MPVIVIAEVPGQTQEGFASILKALTPALKQAPGFILVTGFPGKEGWQTIEVWESAKEATQFFEKVIYPNLSPHLKPKRTLHELHSMVMAGPEWVSKG